MEDPQNVEILAVILGGLIAGGVGWFVQSRIEQTRLNRLKELLVVGITDDMEASINLYDRLTDDWQKSRIVWFNTITELGESRHTYVNNKDWITLIKSTDLRKKIVRYYRQSANHLLQLQNSQQHKYDIEQKFNSLVQAQMLQNPALTDDEARTIVRRTMEQEATELDNVERMLPELVNKLRDFKSDAKEIRNELQGDTSKL